MRTWADVGIVLPYGATGEVRLLCPRCSASRRKSRVACLTVHVGKKVWRCWHCGWEGSLQGRHQRYESPPPPRSPAQPDERRRAALRRVWGEASPITPGDPVWTYLHWRGIPLPLADLPSVLRHHPRLIYRHEDGHHTYHPAMVARVDNAQGQGVSLHRTSLASDGHKAAVPAARKLMPTAIPGATRGGAIRLYPPSETLVISEGVETGLAVRLATGLPIWASICADGMARLVVPPEVSLVVIAADNDPAGLAAARALARRLLVEQRRVKILTPETPGADWADLQEVAHGYADTRHA